MQLELISNPQDKAAVHCVQLEAPMHTQDKHNVKPVQQELLSSLLGAHPVQPAVQELSIHRVVNHSVLSVHLDNLPILHNYSSVINALKEHIKIFHNNPNVYLVDLEVIN